MNTLTDITAVRKASFETGMEVRYISGRNGKLFLPNFSRTPDVVGRYLRTQVAEKGRKVVFLFDSVSYSKFKSHFRKSIDTSRLKLYSSNFPPNTYNVYPSIFFGVPVSRHNIPGTAFNVRRGLLNLLANKIYKLDGRKVENTGRIWDSHLIPFPAYSKRKFCAVLPDKQWLKTEFWRRMFAPATPMFVSRVGSKGDYRYDQEFSSIIERVSRVLKETQSNVMVYLDFDEVMHLFGVETKSTCRLLRLVADLTSQIVENNSENDYYFVSDHGHIDQESVKNANLSGITKSFYCMDGGAGRTRYFYTRNAKAFEYLENIVGDTGIVVRRGDRILNMLFGFDTAASDRIGDIVAIATKPNFPSHGWKYVGEHGGASIEEYSVPFLHLTPNPKNV